MSDLDKYFEESKRAWVLVENYRRQDYGSAVQLFGFRSFRNSLKPSLGQR